MCRKNCVPSPAPSVRALDESGDIRHNEADFTLRIANRDHSKIGLERGERIIRNLRPRRRDARDQRGLAHVRISHESHVREQLQLEAVSMFLARTPRFVLSRGLMHRCSEARIAASAAASAGNHETLIGLRKLEDFLAGLVIVDDGSDGNLQNLRRRHRARSCSSLRRGVRARPGVRD